MTKTIEGLTAPITGWWITGDGEYYSDEFESVETGQ